MSAAFSPVTMEAKNLTENALPSLYIPESGSFRSRYLSQKIYRKFFFDLNRSFCFFRLSACHKCCLKFLRILWCENGCLHRFLSCGCCFCGCFLCSCCLSGCSLPYCRFCLSLWLCLYFCCCFCCFCFCFPGICVCCTQDAVFTY